MRLLAVEHPDGGGPGVFGDVAALERWAAHEAAPPDAEYDAIVLYGGSTNVADAGELRWMRDELAWLRERVDDGVPVLGVCLGGQLLAAALGAEVTRSRPPEIGWSEVALAEAAEGDPVLGGWPARVEALQWHSWTFAVPDGAQVLADSTVCPQAFRLGRCWGVQFHPEVDAPTLERWISTYRNDPDAVAMGFDPERARAEAAARLPRWSELGRTLFAGFLSAAR